MAISKRYGKEFKRGAARLVVEQGQTRAQAAKQAYHQSRGISGCRKVHNDLQEQKIACCRETVRNVF